MKCTAAFPISLLGIRASVSQLAAAHQFSHAAELDLYQRDASVYEDSDSSLTLHARDLEEHLYLLRSRGVQAGDELVARDPNELIDLRRRDHETRGRLIARIIEGKKAVVLRRGTNLAQRTSTDRM